QRSGWNGLCRALPGETSSVPPVALPIADAANPVGSITSLQDLAPAAGARTTRFCRTLTAPVDCAIAAAHGLDPALRLPSRRRRLRPPPPIPRVVTIAIRPSDWDEVTPIYAKSEFR